jgi:hypothetical protein
MLKHAYDQVPNGHEFDAKVLPDGKVHAFQIDTSTGERKDLGTFGAQQVFQLAKGVANGSAYWDQMVKLGSGLRGMGQQRPPKDQWGGNVKAGEREKESQMIEGAANPMSGQKLAPEQTAP